MIDRINEIEEQAEVILEWCRQQKELPEEKRDIFELRRRGGADWEWEKYHSSHGEPNFHVFEYRLRKRPKTHTATVYWYRNAGGQVGPSLSTQQDHQWPGAVLLGTTTDEFTEPQE